MALRFHLIGLSSALLLCAWLAQPALGQQLSSNEATVVEQRAFLDAHPDLDYRIRGMQALNNGDPAAAMTALQRAAWYADKPSQALVALMYWEGRGVAQDRALAYAWMDLAAERGYPDMLAQRERFWAALDASQQARAVSEGQAVYARYGDSVAQDRIARVLRRQRTQMTGSRTGFTGNLNVVVPVPSVGGDDSAMPATITLSGSEYYASKFWNPAEYQAWHDLQWKLLREGRVDVGELEVDKNAKPQPPSRVKPDSE